MTTKKTLEKLITKTLKNEICKYQSLDSASDRKRVTKELLNTFEKYKDIIAINIILDYLKEKVANTNYKQ